MSWDARTAARIVGVLLLAGCAPRPAPAPRSSTDAPRGAEGVFVMDADHAATERVEGGAARNDVVANVRGQEITRWELMEAAVDWHGAATLDELITRILLDQESARLGVMVTREERWDRARVQVQRARDELRQQLGEQVELEAYLQAGGETVESFTRKTAESDEFRRQVLIEKLIAFRYLTEPTRTVRVLRTDHPDRAEECREKLLRGADFATIARRASTDPLTADQGGELPAPLLLGLGPYGRVADEAAFRLTRTGELTPVIHSEGGYYVLRLESSSPGRPDALYRDVATEAWEKIRVESIPGAAVVRYLQDLRTRAQSGIEVRLQD